MNLKGFGRKQSGYNWGIIAAFTYRNRKKPRKPFVNIVSGQRFELIASWIQVYSVTTRLTSSVASSVDLRISTFIEISSSSSGGETYRWTDMTHSLCFYFKLFVQTTHKWRLTPFTANLLTSDATSCRLLRMVVLQRANRFKTDIKAAW
jgi:hypothetical protein